MQDPNPYSTTSGTGQTMTPDHSFSSGRRMCIKRIDPMAAAKLLGAMYALLGLIFGLFMAMLAVFGMAAGGGDNVMRGAITGLGSLIALPVIYGILGFIGGAIGALIYNLVAGMVGGIVFEVDVN